MPNCFDNRPGADPLEEFLRNLTRRRFFGSMASTVTAGLGVTALGSLLGTPALGAPTLGGLGLPDLPHFAPKAKRVIYMHMEGAPSQLEPQSTI